MKQVTEIEAQHAQIGQRIIGIGRVKAIIQHVNHLDIYVEKEKKSDPESKNYTAEYGQKLAVDAVKLH